jgi:uncharacterized protein (TIGR02145 family)
MKPLSLIVLGFLLLECNEDPDTLRDGSGNNYNTVTVGNQVWISSNLKTTRYCDGSEISEAFDYFKIDTLVTNYGRLYPWSVVDGGKNPCPCGYHVPTVEEYSTLVASLGNDHGAKMKAQKEWSWGGEFATDASGLGMKPSFWYAPTMTNAEDHLRDIRGRSYGYYWLRDQGSETLGKGFTLAYNGKTSIPAEFEKSSYRAIRCIKD